MKTKILSLVMLVIWISLAAYLVYSVTNTIQKDKRITRIEKKVINKLRMIREASNAYLAVNGKYTSDWDSLTSFIDTGRFFITQKTESIKVLAYGKEEVTIKIDTLGSVLVKDSILHKKDYPNFNLKTLPYVPELEPQTKFDIWAGKVNKAGININVIEVRDPKPVNKERKLDNPYEKDWPLGFGSRNDVTTSGNWE